MNARHALASLFTATTATLVGCSSPPADTTAQASATARAQVAANDASRETSQDDAAASRKAIAAQTARYAAEIEAALATAATRPAKSEVQFAPEPKAGTDVEASETARVSIAKAQAKPDTIGKADAESVQASQVDWADLLKAPESDRTTVAAAVKPAPVVVARPASPVMAANVRASLDEMPEPIMVPEGQEIAPTVPTASVATAVSTATKSAVDNGAASVASSLDEQIEKRLADNPRDVAAHLDHQLRLYTAGASVPQLTSMASLPAEDREIVAALMDGLTNFRTTVGNDTNAPLSKKVRPLVDVAERLKSQADLAVPTLALCKRVDGFGTYEPFDPATFPAGRASDAIIYAEVANFSSQKLDGKRWQTTLTQTATLYRDTGVPVLNDKTVEFIDHSRNRRNDFFVVKLLKLPPTLLPGKYVLKVTIVDKQSSRMAEASMNLTIGNGETGKLEIGKNEKRESGDVRQRNF